MSCAVTVPEPPREPKGGEGPQHVLRLCFLGAAGLWLRRGQRASERAEVDVELARSAGRGMLSPAWSAATNWLTAS